MPIKDITSPSEFRNEPVSCQLPMYGETPYQVYASPLGVREIRKSARRYGPLGVPADLQSAAVGFSYLQIRDAAFSLEADYKPQYLPVFLYP